MIEIELKKFAKVNLKEIVEFAINKPIMFSKKDNELLMGVDGKVCFTLVVPDKTDGLSIENFSLLKVMVSLLNEGFNVSNEEIKEKPIENALSTDLLIDLLMDKIISDEDKLGCKGRIMGDVINKLNNKYING